MITQHHLTDLDELLLTVRNKNSAVYIQEAIIAYRTGAYRAAITSTWIAVCYDIDSKLRELASQNDEDAIRLIADFDTQIKNQNIPKLQKLENNLLDIAKDNFEFISSHEYEDLSRLKKDRNLCAHPVYTQNEILFQPTPELVRSHIVHAILHLLQRRPVQGKSAIDSVITYLESRTFPQTKEDVYKHLNELYLQRAKQAFIRNLLICLLKELFSEKKSSTEKIIHSIQAVAKAHPKIYCEVMQGKLSDLFKSLDDQNLGSIFLLFKADSDTWNKLEDVLQGRVGLFIDSLKNDDGMDIIRKYNPFVCLEFPSLHDKLMVVFNSLTPTNQIEIIGINPHRIFADKVIELFSSSSCFRDAESYGKNLLIPISPYLNAEQIIKAIMAAQLNNQINQAAGSPEIVADFFEITKNYHHETAQAWIGFIQSRLEKEDPDDHYAYPKLQALMKSNHLTW